MVNIRELRKERNLSLTKLAELSGITKQGLSRIERGEVEPRIENAKRLGEVLDFDWWKLYE